MNPIELPSGCNARNISEKWIFIRQNQVRPHGSRTTNRSSMFHYLYSEKWINRNIIIWEWWIVIWSCGDIEITYFIRSNVRPAAITLMIFASPSIQYKLASLQYTYYMNTFNCMWSICGEFVKCSLCGMYLAILQGVMLGWAPSLPFPSLPSFPCSNQLHAKRITAATQEHTGLLVGAYDDIWILFKMRLKMYIFPCIINH